MSRRSRVAAKDHRERVAARGAAPEEAAPRWEIVTCPPPASTAGRRGLFWAGVLSMIAWMAVLVVLALARGR